ncbi:MAG: M1 family metallopeptidase [Candidatus Acidiferrales bacterium]
MAVASLCAVSAPPDDLTPRQMFDALNALRINPSEIYTIHDLRLQRDTLGIALDEGELGFFNDFRGKITGAVFTGRGHVVAIPRDSAERHSLARFLGVPVLDQRFTAAYLRFTDNAADELLEQIRSSEAPKAQDADFLTDWNRNAATLNSGHSLRIMMDLLSDRPVPYLFATLWSDSLGIFEVVVDNRHSEQVLVGQNHWAQGVPHYDMWTSFARADVDSPPIDSFQPVAYEISTTIEPDRTLEGTTTITLRSESGGERMVALELSRFLTVQSVEDAAGNVLTCFQNEALSRTQVAEQGNDLVVVVLPQAPPAGQTVKLRFSYRGGVISDAGNGVIFVGDRGSWYPHIGGFDSFSSFDLSFRWPRRVRLIATGTLQSQGEEADWDTARWRSEGDIPVAGFNMGDYRTDTVSLPDGTRIEVLANSQLERSLAALFRPTPLPQLPPVLPRPRSSSRIFPALQLPLGPSPSQEPSPAALVHQVGEVIADAVRIEEHWFGPLPFSHLEVTQIPGDFGQGWPGLIYLPTLTFLSPAEQQRVGLSGKTQEDFNKIVPFHEVAHQWFGNAVGWGSYRDQWIDEGLANYIALLAVDSRNPDEHLLRRWLDQYRRDLSQSAAGGEPVADIGPVTLSFRLESARDPGVYQKIVYGKGTWIFHMLRLMLREPGAADPDARFTALLHDLVRDYRHRSLSNADLERAIEKVMTPSMALEEKNSMAWFFDQWVDGTGIPRYSLHYAAQPKGKMFSLDGTLTQEGVPESFVAAVPLYSQGAIGRPALLGSVVTAGRETRFHFLVATPPKRLLIDPQQTILCLHD